MITIRHFIECDCHILTVGQYVVINGSAARPINEQLSWRHLTLHVFAPLPFKRWTAIGRVENEEVREAVYLESYQRYVRPTGRGLVGSPLNVRGVRGFDSRCVSIVVAIYVYDPETGRMGAMLETCIGDGARRYQRWKPLKNLIDSAFLSAPAP